MLHNPSAPSWRLDLHRERVDRGPPSCSALERQAARPPPRPPPPRPEVAYGVNRTTKSAPPSETGRPSSSAPSRSRDSSWPSQTRVAARAAPVAPQLQSRVLLDSHGIVGAWRAPRHERDLPPAAAPRRAAPALGRAPRRAGRDGRGARHAAEPARAQPGRRAPSLRAPRRSPERERRARALGRPRRRRPAARRGRARGRDQRRRPPLAALAHPRPRRRLGGARRAGISRGAERCAAIAAPPSRRLPPPHDARRP